LKSQSSFLPFFGVEVPQGDGVARTIGWLHFVGISAIRPEKDDPIEKWLDIHHLTGPSLRKYSQQSTIFLLIKENASLQPIFFLNNNKSTDLDIPFFVEVISGGDASSITVRIVNVLYVMGSTRWVACYHRLR